MLVELNLWIYLLLLAIGLLGAMMAAMRPSDKALKKAVIMGLFLAVCDFVFENIGAWKGLWFSSGSSLFVLNVPAEVFLIATAAGVAFYLLFPPYKDALYMVSTSLLIAVIGAGIESILLDHTLLVYAKGWTSYHALAAYSMMFILMHFANIKLHGLRLFHEEAREEYEHPRVGKVVVGKTKRK